MAPFPRRRRRTFHPKNSNAPVTMKPTKYLLAALFSAALVIAPAQKTQAQAPAPAVAADEVNLDFFYNNMKDQGDWLQTPEYGYVFNPRVQRDKTNWRPYSDGYWAHTDEGWLWNSYEDFGWATYHYGRWTRLKEYGWVWVPGYEWAPAWVAWRGTKEDGPTGGRPAASNNSRGAVQVSYVGWAPLPPEAQFDSAIGFNSAVDYRYDIAPDDYAFVETQYFGAPYLAASIIAPLLAYAFWSSTYGYTNTAYCNYGWGRGVYVGGPQYGYLSAYSAQPIPQYQIQRNLVFANGGVNNLLPAKPVNGVIPVFAPRVAPVNAATTTAFKPATVKATLPAGQVQRGWNATKANPADVAKARELVKAQSTGAAPAQAPTAAQRAATMSVPNAAPQAGLPAGSAVVPNAGLNPVAPTNAIVPNAGPVPKNQLSPQNAAAVQASQAAKGVPSTAPNAGVVPKNQLSPQGAAALKAGQPAKGVPSTVPNAGGVPKNQLSPQNAAAVKAGSAATGMPPNATGKKARALVEKPITPAATTTPSAPKANSTAASAAPVKKAPAAVERKAPPTVQRNTPKAPANVERKSTSSVPRSAPSANRSVQTNARPPSAQPKVNAAPKAAAPKKAPAAKPEEKKKTPPAA